MILSSGEITPFVLDVSRDGVARPFLADWRARRQARGGGGRLCGALSSRRARGFTLLEAMVALVIVALGMMAVNGQLNRYVVAASFVEKKTLASWIATERDHGVQRGHDLARGRQLTTKTSSSRNASGVATSS